MFKIWRAAQVVTAAVVVAVLAALSGGLAAATTIHVQTHHHTSGTVGSVNGSSAPGSCGTAGTSGDFTVASHGTTYTVDVGSNSTTFQEKGVSAPSFAIVCPGDVVRAIGAISTGNILTATQVIVIPHRPQHVNGTVASVNGSSTPGSCGTAGTSGVFTVTSPNTTYTVDVGASSTTFQEKGVSAPSFSIVCPGDVVRALGVLSTGNVLTATVVTVIPPRPQHVNGTVTSVNGSSASGSCGTAGTPGDFTLTSHSTTYTVDVGASSTTFQGKGAPTPSFAIVCPGDKVRAIGAITNGNILTATVVTVIPPRPRHVNGTVGSVNGSSTPGSCGTAGTAGDFTLASQKTTYIVDVGASSTTFQEKGVSAPSFAIVCPGDKVRSIGAISTGNVLTATVVTVIPPRPQHANGTVASVNGSSTTGSCGTAGTSGQFTVTSHNTTYTLDVGANSTDFEERGVTAPSFAIVCTGDKVKTVGTISPNNTISADTIVVLPPK
jgi:uncharacterized low-complexity protein